MKMSANRSRAKKNKNKKNTSYQVQCMPIASALLPAIGNSSSLLTSDKKETT